jgi:S1-C subfamily serine protease
MRIERRRAAALAALVGAVLSVGVAAAQETIAALHKRARDAVFLLRVFDAGGSEIGTGTGFLVQDGLVVTNHHVVEGAFRVEAVLADERKVRATGIVALDEDLDLALLRLEPVALRPLQLDTGTVEPGDRVIVLGSPLGLSLSVSDGIVAALRPLGLGGDTGLNSPLLQITAPISPGSSGSPVLNTRGVVVGVAQAVLIEGQNVNLAVPADSVRALLAKSKLDGFARRFQAEPGVGSWPYLSNLGISALVFGGIFLALRRMR